LSANLDPPPRFADKITAERAEQTQLSILIQKKFELRKATATKQYELDFLNNLSFGFCSPSRPHFGSARKFVSDILERLNMALSNRKGLFCYVRDGLFIFVVFSFCSVYNLL